MSTIDVNFDGRNFVPQQPVNLPPGTRLQIILVRPPERQHPVLELAKLVENAPIDPSAPSDLAKEIDHYLYGMPKQGSP